MSAALALTAAASARSHAVVAEELEALCERLRGVTVRIHTRGGRFDGVGAGVLWPFTGQRLVVTNTHVVPPSRGDELYVEHADRRVTAARVIARDTDRDLALLQLDDDGNGSPSVATIGDARALRAGELLVALGHPFGVGGALSVGVVHAAPNSSSQWVRADVRLAPGNSGGPLATLDGAVVGINAMIADGLGIAVPAHLVQELVRAVVHNEARAAP